MKKVTFFLNQFPVASETFVINQIVGLIEQGLDVDIISVLKGDLDKELKLVKKYNLLDRTSFLTDESFTDSVLKKRFRRVLSLFKFNNLALKVKALNVREFGLHSKSLLLSSIVSNYKHQYEADVFLAHFGTSGVIANKLRELGLLKGKLATVFHGADISVESILSNLSQDYQKLFQAGELMLPISNLWKEKLLDLGCAPEKVLVNRMGIEHLAFPSRDLSTPLSHPLKIISVARFTEKKGLDDAIKSMYLLKNKGINFHYNLVGDGELKSQLEEQIKLLDLTEHVSLLGFQSQETVSQLLQQADIFLLPSVTARSGDMEGIPVSLMESMAMGLITISTYHSGIPELITHGESGLLVPERSPEKLAQSLISLVNSDIDIISLRKNAYQKVQNSYEQSKLYVQLANALKNL